MSGVVAQLLAVLARVVVAAVAAAAVEAAVVGLETVEAVPRLGTDLVVVVVGEPSSVAAFAFPSHA